MTTMTTEAGNAAATGGTPLLQLRGVNKSFGAVQVLHDVDLTVRLGRVTALVGDNGAGKSTLIKGVAGIHAFDSGDYVFEGQTVHVHNPKQANALGIEVVYQDLALCDNLDIVQNLYLGKLTAQVEAKDVSHSEVVQLITGGELVKEGDKVVVTDPHDTDLGLDPGSPDATPGQTGAQS